MFHYAPCSHSRFYGQRPRAYSKGGLGNKNIHNTIDGVYWIMLIIVMMYSSGTKVLQLYLNLCIVYSGSFTLDSDLYSNHIW